MKKPNLAIAHGKTYHLISKKGSCRICQKVNKEFEEDMKKPICFSCGRSRKRCICAELKKKYEKLID